MPQVQEYLPQTQAQEPVGGVSPNLEMAGAVGKGIEHLGQDITDAGATVHRYNVQKENADSFAATSDMRADYTDRVQSGVQDGSLDVDKVLEDFDNDSQKGSENLGTSEGKNYFERQNARLRGQIIQSANRGMAQVAARNAKGMLQRGIDQTGVSVRRDPLSYNDAVDSVSETVDQLITNGGLPEGMRAQAENEFGTAIAKNAVRGLADSDPALAKQALDAKHFDKYLSGDELKSMYSEVDTMARAKEVEGRATERKVKDAQKAASEAYGVEALPKLQQGALNTKDVLANVQNGTLKWEEGQRWIKAIDARAKEKAGKSDPRLFVSLANRITGNSTEPPIEDIQDLLVHVGNGLNTEGLNKLSGLIDKVHPEIRQGDRQVLKTLQSTIRFKNPMTNQYDLRGETNLSQAMHDYADAKTVVKQKGGTVHDLVDPQSPFYFATPERMAKYQTSLQEQLSGAAQDRTNKALDLPRQDHNGDANQKSPNKKVKLPNESADAFLKRQGLGG